MLSNLQCNTGRIFLKQLEGLLRKEYVYSYFEIGCRKKCTRQSRKVLWVVLSSLFFKEIWRAGEAMDVCLRVLKESNKSRFDSYRVRNSVLVISHITFRDCRLHIFFDNLSPNSCISGWVEIVIYCVSLLVYKPQKFRILAIQNLQFRTDFGSF